jgi:DNA replication protein DnaC
MMTTDLLKKRAELLGLIGILAHWETIQHADWLESLLSWEEVERSRRGLERRLSGAHLKKFRPITEFDWDWPKKCDRQLIEELMTTSFLKEASNVIFCGPSSVGKTMLAKNIAWQAILNGHRALFVTAGKMLTDLNAEQGDAALRRHIQRYLSPHLLVIDEVGYLSYSNRSADLLFEIISGRYQEKSTIITTNIPFTEWNTVFPNAACVVSLIERLVHNAEIINIEAESFRLKEATERQARRAEERNKQKSSSKQKKSVKTTEEVL